MFDAAAAAKEAGRDPAKAKAEVVSPAKTQKCTRFTICGKKNECVLYYLLKGINGLCH